MSIKDRIKTELITRINKLISRFKLSAVIPHDINIPNRCPITDIRLKEGNIDVYVKNIDKGFTDDNWLIVSLEGKQLLHQQGKDISKINKFIDEQRDIITYLNKTKFKIK